MKNLKFIQINLKLIQPELTNETSDTERNLTETFFVRLTETNTETETLILDTDDLWEIELSHSHSSGHLIRCRTSQSVHA